MIALALNAVVLGGLVVLLVAAASALKEGVRRRVRIRGLLPALLVLLLSLALIGAVLL